MSQTFIFTDETKDVVMARVLRFIDLWPKDKPCEITVKRFKKSRTNKQNAALFGLAYKILSDETGHEMEELHDYFCRRFFGVEEYEVLGEPRSRPRRTTTTNEEGKRDVLSWDVFSDFFDMVQRTAAEMEIFIPDPDPEWFTKRSAA